MVGVDEDDELAKRLDWQCSEWGMHNSRMIRARSSS